MSRHTPRSGIRRYANLVNLGGLLIVVCTTVPLFWMASASFKGPGEISATPPTLLPESATPDNYDIAFVRNGIGHYFLNSVVVACCSTVLILSLAFLAGYALARLPLRGRGAIMTALLMLSVFPPIALLVPLFLMERQAGLLNSYPGLVIPYVALNLPFAIWIMRNYLSGIPRELEEAATVDGAGPLRTALTVILPLARPGLFTAGVFSFTATWSEFLLALTFNGADDRRTVPVGIALFTSQYQVPYGVIFAGAMVATVPIALLVLIFRRSIVSGMTTGAVKG
ncbi:carbohydrate ABC transporter permease [Streptomyces sp. CHA1]|uniref:carbohydrate ABC transporter permease n=1 Tax=Streptomyces TaxID=1883 RepID=UPI000309F4FC|nr:MULTISPECIES: carbohydrate ABC transporter permease [Streptomyces]QOZ99749.1 carbohydrate ABC transporter permease [Streptomyces violascens]WDV31737.1 carbohydrate ABC transporter permease [Streptomyces sp. AD16]ESP99442.1 binding-protein-dependent transport system inner membrane protein [Streptomyces sp. GBA 94-10 4N24]ESQ06436.1 binding-protein-dependent transport system inner membrane protein [Streptomyces sp. PVA_94-07]MBT3160181.1 carbohydrate ABC transporter permease [Streptomyces sp.